MEGSAPEVEKVRESVGSLLQRGCAQIGMMFGEIVSSIRMFVAFVSFLPKVVLHLELVPHMFCPWISFPSFA